MASASGSPEGGSKSKKAGLPLLLELLEGNGIDRAAAANTPGEGQGAAGPGPAGDAAAEEDVHEYPGHGLIAARRELVESIYARVVGETGRDGATAVAETMTFCECPIDVRMPQLRRAPRRPRPHHSMLDPNGLLSINNDLRTTYLAARDGYRRWELLRREGKDNWYERWDDGDLHSAVYFTPPRRIAFARSADANGAQQHGAHAADMYIQQAYAPELHFDILNLPTTLFPLSL
eukprot:jgi/Tetstr1/458838/TSEL_045221.t1